MAISVSGSRLALTRQGTALTGADYGNPVFLRSLIAGFKTATGPEFFTLDGADFALPVFRRIHTEGKMDTYARTTYSNSGSTGRWG